MRTGPIHIMAGLHGMYLSSCDLRIIEIEIIRPDV